jgi:hypothetical protein
MFVWIKPPIQFEPKIKLAVTRRRQAAVVRK